MKRMSRALVAAAIAITFGLSACTAGSYEGEVSGTPDAPPSVTTTGTTALSETLTVNGHEFGPGDEPRTGYWVPTMSTRVVPVGTFAASRVITDAVADIGFESDWSGVGGDCRQASAHDPVYAMYGNRVHIYWGVDAHGQDRLMLDLPAYGGALMCRWLLHGGGYTPDFTTTGSDWVSLTVPFDQWSYSKFLLGHGYTTLAMGAPTAPRMYYTLPEYVRLGYFYEGGLAVAVPEHAILFAEAAPGRVSVYDAGAEEGPSGVYCSTHLKDIPRSSATVGSDAYMLLKPALCD